MLNRWLSKSNQIIFNMNKRHQYDHFCKVSESIFLIFSRHEKTIVRIENLQLMQKKEVDQL